MLNLEIITILIYWQVWFKKSYNIYFLNYKLNNHLLPLNGFFTKRYYYWNKFLFWNPELIKFDFGKINNFEKIHLEGDFDNTDIRLNLNKN